MRELRAWLVVVSSTLAGCTCVDDPADHRFACANDSTCADGFRCLAGFCALQAAGDAGEDAGASDAGLKDGGATDGGPADAGGTDAGKGDGGVEQDCADGLDDDGDSLIDCADPDCALRSCHKPYADHVCCSQSVNGCIALNSHDNCGGCGIKCGPAALCVQQPVVGGFSGYCACTGGGGCPGSDAGVTSPQSCFGASACACSTNDACASGEVCDHTLAYGVCRY